jgi:hypothetical protein
MVTEGVCAYKLPAIIKGSIKLKTALNEGSWIIFDKDKFLFSYLSKGTIN